MLQYDLRTLAFVSNLKLLLLHSIYQLCIDVYTQAETVGIEIWQQVCDD